MGLCINITAIYRDKKTQEPLTESSKLRQDFLKMAPITVPHISTGECRELQSWFATQIPVSLSRLHYCTRLDSVLELRCSHELSHFHHYHHSLLCCQLMKTEVLCPTFHFLYKVFVFHQVSNCPLLNFSDLYSHSLNKQLLSSCFDPVSQKNKLKLSASIIVYHLLLRNESSTCPLIHSEL